jgi:drug/metabolite transporter (DMT)-like permease
VLRWRGAKPPTARQWRALGLLSIFMVLLSNGFVTLAETQVGSGLAAIAVASMPLFAGVFAMLRGRHPSKLEWMGLIVGFVGVLWLSIGGELSGSMLGLVCLIIAPLAWAWGSIWSRDQDLPEPFMAAAGQMLAGTAWLVVAALLRGEHFNGVPSFGATAAMLYLVVAGSIFGFTAYIWLLHHVRPALATSYAYVNPPLAVLIGALIGGESFTRHDLGAMAVILVGVVIITMAKARASTPAVDVTPAAAGNADDTARKQAA